MFSARAALVFLMVGNVAVAQQCAISTIPDGASPPTSIVGVNASIGRRFGRRRSLRCNLHRKPAIRVIVRSGKYLNNLIEQDHRRVKQRLRPMLGLKSFETAEVVIGGIELADKIKNGQFKMGKLGGRKATIPAIWWAALSCGPEPPAESPCPPGKPE